MDIRVIGKRLIALSMGLIIVLETIAYGQSDLTQQGIAFLQAQRFREAVRLFTQIVKKDPNNTMAIYYRGMARHYLNDTDAAIADYTTILSYKPFEQASLEKRGKLFLMLKFYQEAIQDFDFLVWQ